ncbi:MAG: hypothetical protein AAF597_17460 [Bacteroidota bacterium]
MKNLLTITFLLTIALVLSACKSTENIQPAATIELSYDCFGGNDDNEVFIVIEEEPVFQNGMDDLITYLRPVLDEALPTTINGAEIKLGVIVLSNGAACLSKVTGTNVDENSLPDFQALVREMPAWTPGLQGGLVRNTLVTVTVQVEGGSVGEITAVVGR